MSACSIGFASSMPTTSIPRAANAPTSRRFFLFTKTSSPNSSPPRLTGSPSVVPISSFPFTRAKAPASTKRTAALSHAFHALKSPFGRLRDGVKRLRGEAVQNLWADRPALWTGSSISAMMSAQRAYPEQLRKTNRRHPEGRPRPAATWDSCRFPDANRRWPDSLFRGQGYADRKPDTRSSPTRRTPRRRRAQIRRSAILRQAPAQESRLFLTQPQVPCRPPARSPAISSGRGTTCCARSPGPPRAVISYAARRRFFPHVCSRKRVGLRRENRCPIARTCAMKSLPFLLFSATSHSPPVTRHFPRQKNRHPERTEGPAVSSTQLFNMLTPNLDMAFVPARRCKVIGKLHAQPRFRCAAESFGQPNSHLRADARLAVHDVIESLPRDA